MANFESWMSPAKRRHRRIMAGYQNLKDDPGNYTGGKIGVGAQIGTNRSIAAPTLVAWRGGHATKQDMVALSVTEAKQIYKAKYWDKIYGDHINSQALADILADMKSSAGGNAIKQMQRVLNDLGESLSVDGAFGAASLAALNRQIFKVGQARIFNAFRDRMIAYYQSLNSRFEKVWVGSLNKDYPPMEEGMNTAAILENGVVIVAAIAAMYLAWRFYKIYKPRLKVAKK